MAIRKRIQSRTPEVCPVCGEDVPRDVQVCPECGADHSSGWRDDAVTYDGVDLAEDGFDYDVFVRQEFGSQAKLAGLKTVWWIVAIAMLVSLVFYFFAAR